MSNTAIVLPQVNLPAEILEQFGALNGANDLDAGVNAGFPVMSIRGAKWRVVENGEEHPIYMPGTRDLAPAVKVVILKANSAISKTYYAGAYVEGSDAAPTCYSNDGIRPAPDAESPQSETCATCPHNVWGSKISPSGAKIKACADVRRVALLPADDMDYSPLLLRIPGASLSDLAAYGRALAQRKIPYAAVVTKLSFDPEAAFPKILFQFDRVLTAEELTKVAARITEPVIDDILGITSRGAAPAPAAPAAPAADKFGIPADAAAPAQPDEKQAEPQPEPQAEKPKRTRARKSADPAPEPEEQQAAPAAMAPQADEDAMAAEIEAALAELKL